MKIKNIVMALAAAAVMVTSVAATAQDKPLKVGSTPTGVPFTFLDAKTNSIQGIMVDIIRDVAADAGFKVEIEGMSFSTLIPSLTGNKIDIIAAAMYITPPRQEVVDFSRPIYTYGEGLIVAKKDTKEYTKLIYDNIPAILSDVNAGRIQAGFADKPIVAYNLQQGAFADTRLVKGYVSTLSGSVGIGVRKGDAALLKRINTSLEKLQKNGTIDKILAKWGQ